MKQKAIKSKIGNPKYTQFLETEIELIKKQCNISASETVYFLCHHKWMQIFLINGIIYVANVSCEFDKNKHRVISSMSLVELYRIKLHNKYPKTLKDIRAEYMISFFYVKFDGEIIWQYPKDNAYHCLVARYKRHFAFWLYVLFKHKPKFAPASARNPQFQIL